MLLTNLPALLTTVLVAVPLGIGNALPSCMYDQSEPDFHISAQPFDETIASLTIFFGVAQTINEEISKGVKDIYDPFAAGYIKGRTEELTTAVVKELAAAQGTRAYDKKKAENVLSDYSRFVSHLFIPFNRLTSRAVVDKFRRNPSGLGHFELMKPIVQNLSNALRDYKVIVSVMGNLASAESKEATDGWHTKVMGVMAIMTAMGPNTWPETSPNAQALRLTIELQA